MVDEAPSWLLTMRSISGISETPGTADNPKILAMADEIARIFPEMKSYCDGYNADSIPWCGLTEAYCMAKAGIRPPFGATDTDKFLWARSWEDDPGYAVLKAPRLGCVVVLTRSGGGHVSTYESTSGSNYMLRGGNQSDAINLAAFPKSNVVALVWPKEGGAPPPIDPPSAAKPTLRKGDSGVDVAYMQTLLPKWIDGDFGTTTESLVKEFQRSKALEADGICGPDTWAALMEEEPLPAQPSADVRFAAEGKCSWFGGPDDPGVKPDEGLAFISNVAQAPHLFLPQQPAGTTGLARRLNPEVYYIACRWDYKNTPRDMLLKETALVRAGDHQLRAYPADWGPNEKTGRVADISPGLMEALEITTDDEVEVIFPAPQ